MKIVLDGITQTIPDGWNITQLIEWTKEGDPHLMVEVNYRYIPPGEYEKTMINENDSIEFINPNLGG